jgi:hypothetical protein
MYLIMTSHTLCAMHLHAVIPFQICYAFMHIVLDNVKVIKEFVNRLFLVDRQIRSINISSIVDIVYQAVILN